MAYAPGSRNTYARALPARFGKLSEQQRQDLLDLQALTGKARETLERLLTCGSYRVELAAAQEVFDRTYGRPDKHTTSHVHHSSAPQLPDDPQGQLELLLAAVDAVRGRIVEAEGLAEARPELEGGQNDLEEVETTHGQSSTRVRGTPHPPIPLPPASPPPVSSSPPSPKSSSKSQPSPKSPSDSPQKIPTCQTCPHREQSLCLHPYLTGRGRKWKITLLDDDEHPEWCPEEPPSQQELDEIPDYEVGSLDD